MPKNNIWLKDAVIYQIFIDRFAGVKNPNIWDKPEFIGGNIKGIIEKLSYVESLGVNAIWLSPFFKGNAYHGYHTTDFYDVDKHFGDQKDIGKLIEEAHKRNIKVICDFVPNHCSYMHPFFIDAQKNPNSIYKNWFIFDKWPDKYMSFLNYKELPKLNLDYKPAFDYILGAAKKWLNMGFDGLRIDHIIGLSNQNIKDLFEPLKKEFSNTVFIGEATCMGIKWNELKTLKIPKKRIIWLLKQIGLSSLSNNLMYKNYIGLIDALLNFEAADQFRILAKSKNIIKINKSLISQQHKYQGKLILPTFLDNHDMERFLFKCGNDVEKLKKIAKLQFLLNQPTIIYYGTEIGLTQYKPFSSKKSYADLLARRPMEWDKSKQNQELLLFYKNLIKKTKI